MNALFFAGLSAFIIAEAIPILREIPKFRLNTSLSGRELIGEAAACACMFVFLIVLLVFGSAVIPYQPGMHSEATHAGLHHAER